MARPSEAPRRVAICGSTGSIGTQALEVIAESDGRFEVVALAAQRCSALLVDQAQRWHPEVVVLADARAAGEFSAQAPQGTEVLVGREGLEAVAAGTEVTLNAIVGFAGLPVTLAALAAGRRLALANKESLIAARPLVERLRHTPGAELLPVDSEHGAIFQCLGASHGAESRVARLVLTASGGPFRGRPLAELAEATVAEALAHPTWQMGPKITVDSSTLMNKGLEVIEAAALFEVDFDRIEVVVHPQSIVHSMVEFTDGTTLAQLSRPDMRLPIGYALGYPDRLEVPYGALDFTEAMTLTFEAPDRATFACLDLAYAAGRRGGAAPAWLSAANEVAVEAFLAGALSWGQIAEVVGRTMDAYRDDTLENVEALLEADASARRVARSVVER